MGEWTLVLPAPDEWITANQRIHHMVRARRTRAWRAAAAAYARSEGLPRHLPPVHILAYLHLRGARRRDPANWSPTAKAAVDGLRDAGVLDDDDHTHLIGPDMRHGEPATGPRPPRRDCSWWGTSLELVITTLEEQ